MSVTVSEEKLETSQTESQRILERIIQKQWRLLVDEVGRNLIIPDGIA